jgi:hypothetical protein
VTHPLDAAFRFNPAPAISVEEIAPDIRVVVVDDVMMRPDLLREFAIHNQAHFQPAPFNAFPGAQFPVVEDLSARLNDFFIAHMRPLLSQWMNIRKGVRMWSRLSIVSLPERELQPMQSICHRDTQLLDGQQSIAASVLYLFEDARLGGTCFFQPKRSAQETALLIHQSSTLDASGFQSATGITPGYPIHSNDYFEMVGAVPAKFNRMIFYDGAIFHSGHITSPDLLRPDPASGRLTLNGFFICSQKAVR